MFKIKICGITNLRDYNLINHLGVNYSGFIFSQQSSRTITMEKAAEIIEKGASESINVGVFVDESIERIKTIYDYVKLDLVQLHGTESPDFCKELKLPYLKVIRPKNIESLKTINDFPDGVILLDSYSEAQFGGTGRTISNKILDKAATYKRELIIAGGISEYNIDQFFSKNIHGVDLSSSVEKSPGQKDEKKLISFFKKVNNLRRANYE